MRGAVGGNHLQRGQGDSPGGHLPVLDGRGIGDCSNVSGRSAFQIVEEPVQEVVHHSSEFLQIFFIPFFDGRG